MLQIKFKKVIPDAKIPYRGSATSAGWDLFATKVEERSGVIAYHTGLAMEIPVGYYGLVVPRSSIYQTNRRFVSPGVIDSDFRGEIIIFMDSVPDLVCPAIYKAGDRVGQIIISPIPEVYFEEVEDLSLTKRGTSGYGSTGGLSSK